MKIKLTREEALWLIVVINQSQPGVRKELKERIWEAIEKDANKEAMKLISPYDIDTGGD